ncbi:hypothetical protein EHS25_006452 [Saitozyma podzolica]|uniref:Haloacid dehalogenase, type II n=1 Tax=Saitozyma podzolica TaxID=1890683 RepID=A0A427YRQ3_9TREE|nr:hypothetical protein EHS25_006452 [Saitozyma podzolica]
MSKVRRLSIPASEAELSKYKVLVFDCYGTLIDWERGMWSNLQPIFTQKTCPDPERVFESFGQAETRLQGQNKGMEYPLVLEQAYLSRDRKLGADFPPGAASAFGASVGSWPPFRDSSLALAKLKDLGLSLVVLSNVDNASFAQTRKHLEAGWEFDLVCTAEDIGSYKPDLRNFQYVLEAIENELDVSPREVLSVAQSKYHDVHPAQTMGLKTVWINRPEAIMGKPKDESIQPDWEFSSMEAFAHAMERAHGVI